MSVELNIPGLVSDGNFQSALNALHDLVEALRAAGYEPVTMVNGLWFIGGHHEYGDAKAQGDRMVKLARQMELPL